MNKDQMAIYLNEHLEFFNEYPELLKKIKEIKDDEYYDLIKTFVSDYREFRDTN